MKGYRPASAQLNLVAAQNKDIIPASSYKAEVLTVEIKAEQASYSRPAKTEADEEELLRRTGKIWIPSSYINLEQRIAVSATLRKKGHQA